MKRLYQTVANALRKDIAEGKFAVGQRLPAERLLAEQFEVSRPTIREAVIALEISGLVEVRGGSGVYVVSTDGKQDANLSDLDVGPFELMEARRIFESDMAAVAAERISEEELAQLDELLVEMARENEIGAAGEKADKAFHLAIAQATQNSAVVSVEEWLWAKRETSPMVVEMLNRSRAYGVQPMIKDHKLIVDALRKRTPEAARAAMSQHLSNVIDALLEVSEAEAVDKARSEALAKRTKYLGLSL